MKQTVKKVTISLPNDVYRTACLRAAERNTTVSALVHDFLGSLGHDESDLERRRRLQHRVIAGIRSFQGCNRLTRAQVHDRPLLHQHPARGSGQV